MRPHHQTLPIHPVFDFSANLNPFAEILRADTFLKRLEDPDASRSQWHETLLENLAELHHVSSDQIALTCGATEAIHLVVRSLKLKSGLVVEPTSLEYRFAMNLYGIEVRNVLLKERAGFHLTISEMMNALHAVGFLAISNPNSPTASEWNLSDLELIMITRETNKLFLWWMNARGLERRAKHHSFVSEKRRLYHYSFAQQILWFGWPETGLCACFA